MVKSDRFVNPADAERRREKLRDIKRHRQQRRVQRDAKLERSSADDIRDAIEAIDRAGRTTKLTSKDIEQRTRLVAQLNNAQERQQQATHDHVSVIGLEQIIGAEVDEQSDDADDIAQDDTLADADNGYAQNTPHVALARAHYQPHALLPPPDADGVIHITKTQTSNPIQNGALKPNSQTPPAHVPRPNMPKRRREASDESNPLLAYLNDQQPIPKRPTVQPRSQAVNPPTALTATSSSPSSAPASAPEAIQRTNLKPAFLPPSIQTRHHTQRPAATRVPSFQRHQPSVAPLTTSKASLPPKQDSSVSQRSSSSSMTATSMPSTGGIDDAVDAFLAELG